MVTKNPASEYLKATAKPKKTHTFSPLSRDERACSLSGADESSSLEPNAAIERNS